MSGRAFTYASLFALLGPAALQGQARSLSLRDAVARALADHPDLRAAEADVAIARGELVSARAVAFNPAFTASAGPARTVDTSLTSRQFGLSQTLELWGKRTRRGRVAALRLDAAHARRDRQRSLVTWRAQRAFHLALVARERLATAAEADTVGLALVTAAQDRLSLGSGTLLELNVAAAANARDRRNRLDAERQLASALFDLRAAIGAGVRDSVVPVGALPPADMSAQPLDSLVSLAFRRRSDFTAVRTELEAAREGVRLARTLVLPDPEVGFSAGRAEDFRVKVLSVSLPLPFWNWSRGPTAVAVAMLDRARVREDSARRALELEVRDAHQALTRALASREALETQVIEKLAENLALARESFQAGKISLFTYNTIRRDMVEARLAYLDTLAETVERRYALALATGEPWE